MTIKNAFAIPDELRSLKQWILWKYEDKGGLKPTKVPYSITHSLASVTDPSTWATFTEAYNVYQFGGYDGIGFVFTENDPYCFIDLDDTNGDKESLNRQQLIFKSFNSYSELSPSGKGLHIIIKGSIPQGRKRSNVEIYSSLRYATMTGNVYNNAPIEDRNDLVNQLFAQMGGKPTLTAHTGNEPERYTDEEIINQCSSAANGHKFDILFAGDWQSLYPSQSEADFAIVDIIAFYTQNETQIGRIFKSSQLGKRKKAQRSDYLKWMINKSFDKTPPNIDFDGFRIALEERIAEKNEKAANSTASGNGVAALDSGSNSGLQAVDNDGVSRNGSASVFGTEGDGSIPSTPANLPSIISSPIQPPPGLVGEIAQFIYRAAPRPVPEIALAAAIGFMAGICGRAYNVSGTGLNQYVLLLANTGTGKESMASGIDKIINEVSMQVPIASEFIGPSEIASGQALIKFLANKSQSFVSILGEFGKRLQVMADPRANGAEKTLNRMMLDLYNKSGHGQVARPSIYADSEKNTNLISSPAFSILAESTPETFYSSLSEEMISDGLLPRFMLIEYSGPRPALNENHRNAGFDKGFIDKIGTLMASVKTLMANRQVTNVIVDDEAASLLYKFDKLADGKINATDKEVVRQLWNRAHIKVMKIAALIAVGVNYANPIVTKDYVLWAKSMVENDIRALSAKFESGVIGRNSDEIKQYDELLRAIKIYITSDWSKVKSYTNGDVDYAAHSNKYITHTYLSTKVSRLAAYRKDRIGATNALKRIITLAIDNGVIVEVSRKEMLKLGKAAQKAYMLVNADLL